MDVYRKIFINNSLGLVCVAYIWVSSIWIGMYVKSLTCIFSNLLVVLGIYVFIILLITKKKPVLGV